MWMLPHSNGNKKRKKIQAKMNMEIIELINCKIYNEHIEGNMLLGTYTSEGFNYESGIRFNGEKPTEYDVKSLREKLFISTLMHSLPVVSNKDGHTKFDIKFIKV